VTAEGLAIGHLSVTTIDGKGISKKFVWGATGGWGAYSWVPSGHLGN